MSWDEQEEQVMMENVDSHSGHPGWHHAENIVQAIVLGIIICFATWQLASCAQSVRLKQLEADNRPTAVEATK